MTTNKENKENLCSDGNNHFAKFIAAELDQLPKKFQRIARYEITNALYNVQKQSRSTPGECSDQTAIESTVCSRPN